MKNPTPKSAGAKENLTLRALYLIAIVLVVDGHTTLADMFDMDSLFRYYSFHLMLFAFGSGYFFTRRGSMLADLGRRAKRMLLPLYGWNIVYGLGAAFLRRFGGFEFGEPLSAYTLLLAPVLDGEHFVWNLGSWFVFPLFLCQVLYSLLDRASRLWKENDYLSFLLCLIPGVITAQLCFSSQSSVWPLFLSRTLILLPGYALGVLYRRKLERLDTLPTVPYLLAIVILRALLCTRYDNLAYLLSNCTYFGCGAFGLYASALLAIAFYLRIARLLSPLMERSRIALSLSRHTFDIMMHHYMGFFALNCVFLALNAAGIGAADFSVHAFRTVQAYNYAPQGRAEWNILYLLAGLFFPLAVVYLTERAKALFSRLLKKA